MSDLNKTIIIGRLTKDPELKHTPNGTSVASFSIANNRTYVSDGEKKEIVSFINCVAWGKTGEVITEYCKKGHRIGIEGKLQQRSWEAQDGSKRSAVEIVIDNFQFLEPKQSEHGLGAPVSSAPPQTDINPFADDEAF